MTSKVGLVSLPFAGGYYRSKSRAFNDKRLINWYVNYPDDPGINEYQLLSCPGIDDVEYYFSPGANIRGACVMNGKLFFVVGNRVDVIDYVGGVLTGNEVTNFPNFIGGTGRVVMAAIKNQLVIVAPGVGGYHYTDGVGFVVPITSPNFLIADSVVAIDSYFVFSQTGTNVIFSSALNDGLTYAALDSYIVSQMQTVVGLIVYRNQLYVLGDKLIIPFSNAAQLQFAFRPIPNAAIDNGVETNYLSLNIRAGFVFVGRSINSALSIWLYSSGLPVKIATPPIESLLNQCTDLEIENAFLMQYTEPGTECVTITFDSGGTGYCFVYDLRASAKSGKPEWHERRDFIGGADIRWGVIYIINCFRKNLVFRSSALGVMNDSIGTEFGSPVRRVLNTQPYSMMGANTKVSSLEIYTDVGVDDNAPITISWSDDGGFNYGNKLSLPTGATGEYNTRLIWTGLGGFSRQRMLQIEYTGEYPRSINKIMANIQ